MSRIPMSLDEEFERKLQELKKTYPYDIMAITGLQPKQLDFVGYIKDFSESNNLADNSIDGTSNQSLKDVVSLENDISKPMFKMVAYNKIYIKLREKYGKDVADSWLKSEYTGKSYLHDAHTSTLIPYCYAYDITRLATEGLFFLSNADGLPYNNEPAKHLDVFINHLKEFISFTANRQAGAVGLPGIIVWLYYFFRKDVNSGYNGCKPMKDGSLGIEDFDNIDYSNQNVKYFTQCIQSFIYAVNQPYLRNSVQCAFTNISVFDHNYAHALFDSVVFPDGTLALDVIDDIVELQKLMLTIIADIRESCMFTFPVISISLLTEGKGEDTKFVDEPFAKWASDHNTRWFDSNIFMDDSVTSLSNCCRLKSDVSDFMDEDGYFNSIGGTALSVGSVKVNTVNLAHIAYETITDCKLSYETKNIILTYTKALENNYISKLKEQVKLNIQCLDVIRDIIITNKEKRHLLPNIDDGMIDLEHMYNTVGVIGVYEVLKSFQNKLDSIKSEFGLETSEYDYINYDNFGNIYYTDKADVFVKRIFEEGVHKTSDDVKKQYKFKYKINCEQIPGETAATKLMKKDAIIYPDLVVDDLPLYGNQFIPLGITTTLEERVRVASLFDSYLNGGSICHLNFESTLSKEQAWKYLKWIATQGLTYFAFTTKISVCKHNHAYFGSICPTCGEPTITTFARVVGFYVPSGYDDKGNHTGVGSWSTPRKKEFELRKWE